MHKHTILSVILITNLLVTGCAVAPNISELRNNVTSATFMQVGEEPLNYKIGVVDASSMWAEISKSNISAPGVSASTAAATSSAMHLGTSDGEAKRREASVREIMRHLLQGRPFATEIAKGVIPTIANAWHVNYQPEQLQLLPADTQLADENGVFIGDDPNTDIVVTFSVEELELTEQPSITAIFSAALTLGFNDKLVAPKVRNTITVYKRDVKSQKLKRVWNTHCHGPIIKMPVSEKFSELAKNPEKADPLFEGAVNVTIEYCTKFMKNVADS